MLFYTLVLKFYLKKMGKKKKKKMILSEEKKMKKNKTVLSWFDICRWKRDSSSSEVEITWEIVLFEQISWKSDFWRLLNFFECLIS